MIGNFKWKGKFLRSLSVYFLRLFKLKLVRPCFLLLYIIQTFFYKIKLRCAAKEVLYTRVKIYLLDFFFYLNLGSFSLNDNLL